MSDDNHVPWKTWLALREVLQNQTRLLDAAIHALVSDGAAGADREKLVAYADVVKVVPLMIQGMGVSCHSIIKLTDEISMAVRDCYGIARSIAETAVNVGFIIAGGNEFAKRADQHAFQKTYRDMDRSGALGGYNIQVTASGKPEIDAVPGLREALAAYTTKAGREVTSWTPESLDDRIKFIGERYGSLALNFTGATASIYRHGSEILHGTYFGVVHFWTGGAGGRPGKNRHEVEAMFASNHLIAIFTAVFFSCRGVIEIVGEEFDVPHLKFGKADLHYVEKVLRGLETA